MVGSELPMGNYSGVLLMENCCAFGMENGNGTF